jgi:hypothetical protein
MCLFLVLDAKSLYFWISFLMVLSVLLHLLSIYNVSILLSENVSLVLHTGVYVVHSSAFSQ